MARPSSRSHYRRRSNSPVNGPFWHFFKIILPCSLKDQKMRLPKKFVRQFREELSDVATVVVPNGHAWRIGLKKTKNYIWFDHGWQKFVQHYCIEDRYLIVFKYRGLSNFSVLMFGMNGNEIQYPRSGAARGAEINYDQNCSLDQENMMDLDSPISSPDYGVFDQFVGAGESNRRSSASGDTNIGSRKRQRFVGGQETYDFERFRDKRSKLPMKQVPQITDLDDADESRKEKSNKHQISSRHGSFFNQTKVDTSKYIECDESELLSACEESMETYVCGLSKASEASKRAIRAARMFKPKHPSFMVLLRPYNISKNILHLPHGFAGKYLNEVPDHIKLQVSEGREWTLGINTRERKISKGWNRFHKENDLKEGDVCVFELIKTKKHVLKVTIFRADKDDQNELESKCEERIETGVFRLSKASEASKRAIEAARMFKPEHPSFTALLWPCNFYNSYVYVPAVFAGNYLYEVPDHINLQVSDGREWPVRFSKRECLKLAKGWNRFYKENDLKQGDVCVFELIRSKKYVLKVTIFRAAEYGESMI